MGRRRLEFVSVLVKTKRITRDHEKVSPGVGPERCTTPPLRASLTRISVLAKPSARELLKMADSFPAAFSRRSDRSGTRWRRAQPGRPPGATPCEAAGCSAG